MKFASLLVAAAAANQTAPHWELNAFRDENWPTLYKAWLSTDMTAVEGKGDVTWSQCASDVNVWTFDTAGSSYSPMPVKRGKTLDFTVIGPLSQPIHVDDFTIEVYLGSTKLDTLTMPGGDFTTEFTFSMSQKRPLLTPPGHYTIKAVANGSANGTVLCANAEMDL